MERYVRSLIAAEPEPSSTAGMVGVLHRLCAAAVKALEASGAGVSVMTDQGVRVLAASSGTSSDVIVELQFILGEGPCNDAFASRRPVLEGDLVIGLSPRWPFYSAAAHDQGVRAVFAFPLQVGAARLGVLDLYRGHKGSLSADELSQALTFADIATALLLDGQKDAPEGSAAEGLDEAAAYHSVVHQAQGMVMAQAGVPLPGALALLRAHAFAHDRDLGDLARDVVDRRLRFDEVSA